jgi:hypothetical protein
MADAVTTDVLFNSNNRRTIKITNISDGTGESAVTKIDRTTLTGPNLVDAPTKLVVEEIDYDVQGFTYVKLQWVDATNQEIAMLAGQNYKDFSYLGGFTPDDFTDQAANPTRGDIVLTTVGAVSGDTYDITITVRLKH